MSRPASIQHFPSFVENESDVDWTLMTPLTETTTTEVVTGSKYTSTETAYPETNSSISTSTGATTQTGTTTRSSTGTYRVMFWNSYQDVRRDE